MLIGHAIGETLTFKIPIVFPLRVLVTNSQNIKWTFSHVLIWCQSLPLFHKHPNTLTRTLQSPSQPYFFINEEFKVREDLVSCQVSKLLRNLNSWECGKKNNDCIKFLTVDYVSHIKKNECIGWNSPWRMLN